MKRSSLLGSPRRAVPLSSMNTPSSISLTSGSISGASHGLPTLTSAAPPLAILCFTVAGLVAGVTVLGILATALVGLVDLLAQPWAPEAVCMVMAYQWCRGRRFIEEPCAERRYK